MPHSIIGCCEVDKHSSGLLLKPEARGADKTQQCHKYCLQYSIFASERSQVRTWGRQTCFLPRAPSNLVTALIRCLTWYGQALTFLMHNLEGIIVCSAYALHTSLWLIAPPLARIYWHGIGTKYSVLLQANIDRMCLEAYLLHSIMISLVSEFHNHPSVRHLGTHQGISLGQEIVHLHSIWSNICTMYKKL